MTQLSYVSTKLANLNKNGKIKKDKDGYYTLPLGAFGAFNTAGHYYVLDGVNELFSKNSFLQTKINEGAMYGENGHPKLQGMSEDDAFARQMDTYENRICCHFSEIWIDDELWKKKPNILPARSVAVMGKVKPHGELGHVLEAALSNPKQNTCFSLRGITENVIVEGVLHRQVTHINTYDHVYLPGLPIASKYNSPTLENYTDVSFTKESIIRLSDSIEGSNTASESLISNLHEITKKRESITVPAYASWGR